jgi:hypothetical protein
MTCTADGNTDDFTVQQFCVKQLLELCLFLVVVFCLLIRNMVINCVGFEVFTVVAMKMIGLLFMVISY